jgi:hypothetical protein
MIIVLDKQLRVQLNHATINGGAFTTPASEDLQSAYPNKTILSPAPLWAMAARVQS